MPDRPETYDILIRLDERVKNMHDALLGEDGRIPKVETRVEEHSAQIHQWTGSLKMGVWVFGILITLFGGILVQHIFTDSHNAPAATAPALGTKH